MRYLFATFLLLATGNAFAQYNSDSTGMSPLKTMTYTQYKAYIDGVDINNMGLVAQINHYPEPQKVIGLKKELDLTGGQLSQITAINIELQRKMKEMGDFIIKNERALDALFKTNRIDDGTLIFYTNRYGLYQGEMRNAVLQASVKVQGILTPVQRKKYQQLVKTKV
jgi:hypothetical protein